MPAQNALDSGILTGVRLYIGTYARGGSDGIYAFELDADGRLEPRGLVARGFDLSFLATHPSGDFLYSVGKRPEGDGHVGLVHGYRVSRNDVALEPIGTVESGGVGPCHVAVEQSGKLAVVAHYQGGSVSAVELASDGVPSGSPRVIEHAGSGVHPTRQEAAHVHSSRPLAGGVVVVADLGVDRLYLYRTDSGGLESHEQAFVSLPAGAGPRHTALHPDGDALYCENELDGTVSVFAVEDGPRLRLLETVRSTEQPWQEEWTGAEVAVHPNGRWLYTSSRGPESLSQFDIGDDRRLTLRQVLDCGGRTPRHFALSPDGRYLICAHQDSGTLVSFAVDQESGRLTRIPGSWQVPMPVCVCFL